MITSNCLWASLWWLLVSISTRAKAFLPVSTPLRSSAKLHDDLWLSASNSNEYDTRQGVELPLLDILDSETYRNQYVQPLPSAHLPDEMTTLHVYGMQVVVPVHQSVLEYATEHATTEDDKTGRLDRLFGHLAWKPSNSDNNSLVGAIGCAAQVLVPPGLLAESMTDNDMVESSSEAATTAAQLFETGKPSIMLCRGSFRFVVREIKQSFPFPVAIVDELTDDDDSVKAESTAKEKATDETHKDGNEEEDDDVYADLSESQLIRRTLQSMQSFVDQQLEATSQQVSLLEQSILEQSGMPDMSAQRQATEEMAVVWEIFQQYLVDDCPVSERAFSIAFLAAEMTNLSNDIRRQVLRTTDPVERLRIVLRALESTVGMAQARKMASTISQETARGDGTTDPQELQVGQPSLPPWAANIRKGMRVEYFWNEEWGWCVGTVIEDPVFVVNEYLITLEFQDGEVHKLPFEADEKARWRPAR